MIVWIWLKTLFSKVKQLTFWRVIVGMMLYEPAEIDFEEFYLTIEAEELIVFKFIIFGFEFFDYSIDNQIFTPLL